MTTTLPDLATLTTSAAATVSVPQQRSKPAVARTHTTSRRTTALPAPAGSGPLLTVAEICTELGISLDTWDKWRAAGKTPRMMRLPNRHLRCYRSEFDAWLASLLERGEEAA